MMKCCTALVPILFFFACQKPQIRPTQAAFYCWKTTFKLAPEEESCLDSLACKKLYIKFADIARSPVSGEIKPQASLYVPDGRWVEGKTIVPCVFITNDVFQNLPEDGVEWLAEQTGNQLGYTAGFFSFRSDTSRKPAFPEIQFDCDWTASTQVRYFDFLQKVRAFLPKGTQLSATIRLHQYKFPKQTGVPPVERGLLMFYNTGDLEDWACDNSIFSKTAAETYVLGAPKRYPLPLDLALPLFSWTLVFRDAAFWRILPGLELDVLQNDPKFRRLDAHRFEVVEGTFRDGLYLRPGDWLRFERVSPELLQSAARLSAQLDLADDASVAFFHLDSTLIRRFPAHLLRSVCDSVSLHAR